MTAPPVKTSLGLWVLEQAQHQAGLRDEYLAKNNKQGAQHAHLRQRVYERVLAHIVKMENPRE